MSSERKDYPGNGGDHSVRQNSGETQEGGEPLASHCLRLFITGSTSRSQRAIRNIRQICEENLRGGYELKVIDVSQDPERARQHQILAVPTLLKELLPPLRKIVGDLSEREKVFKGLDIQPR